MADRIDALVEQLGDAAVKVHGIEKSIADMSKRLDAGFAGVDVASSALARYTEFAFERLEEKIDANTAKIDAKIDANAAKLEAKIDANAAKLEAKIDADTANLEEKIEETAAKLDGKMDSGLKRLEKKLDRLIGGASEPL